MKYLRHYFLGEGVLAVNLVFGFIARMEGLRPEASHVATPQYAGILVKLLKTML